MLECIGLVGDAVQMMFLLNDESEIGDSSNALLSVGQVLSHSFCAGSFAAVFIIGFASVVMHYLVADLLFFGEVLDSISTFPNWLIMDFVITASDPRVTKVGFRDSLTILQKVRSMFYFPSICLCDDSSFGEYQCTMISKHDDA